MIVVNRRRVPWVAVTVITVAMLVPGVARAADDLAIAKIGLHLVSGIPGSDACTFIPPTSCIDFPGGDAFTVGGGLDQDYKLYIIALDINRTAGLAAASFAIEYDAGVVVDGWRSCADDATYSPDWPASGSHVGLSFTACAGTQPAPQDPEGDGAVLLGVFHIRAVSPGRFAIGALDTDVRSAEVRSCEGTTTILAWQEPSEYPGLANVALGEVAFEGYAASVCRFPGPVDDGCVLGWTDRIFRCCLPDVGCAGGMAQASARACAYRGGEWRAVPCASGCLNADCLATPVQPSTWGMIKARY